MLLEVRTLAVDKGTYKYGMGKEKKELCWIKCIGSIGVNSYYF